MHERSENLVQIAWFNSPSGATLSRELAELVKANTRLEQDKLFAWILQVSLAKGLSSKEITFSTPLLALE